MKPLFVISLIYFVFPTDGWPENKFVRHQRKTHKWEQKVRVGEVEREPKRG